MKAIIQLLQKLQSKLLFFHRVWLIFKIPTFGCTQAPGEMADPDRSDLR